MTHPSTLAEAFLARAPPGVALPERSRLGPLLVEAFEAARAPWPGLDLPAERFIRHLAERWPPGAKDGVEPAIRGLHLGDLYLACACAAGVPGAADALEREHLSKIPAALRRQRLAPEAVEDVCQKLREKVILNTHIATYSGEGKLSNWIAVIAKRMAAKSAARGPASTSGWSRVVGQLPAAGDLEKDVLKKDLLGELESAMRAAGAALSDEQRELLKFHYRDGLSEPKLAKLFNTSQPTISRRLGKAREIMLAETERLLGERLGLTREDFESFISDVRSRWLDLSLSHVLGGPGESEK